MDDMMTFPDTWEEYEKQYGFNDKDEVYTNGSRLIPSFRVKQWLEHLPTVAKKETVDAISRKMVQSIEMSDWHGETYAEGFCDAIDNVLDLPSIEPRKGRWLKDGDYLGIPHFRCSVCEESMVIPTCMGKPMYKRCPYCGAMMEGSEE